MFGRADMRPKALISHRIGIKNLVQSEHAETTVKCDLAFDQLELLARAPRLFTGEIAVKSKPVEI